MKRRRFGLVALLVLDERLPERAGAFIVHAYTSCVFAPMSRLIAGIVFDFVHE